MRGPTAQKTHGIAGMEWRTVTKRLERLAASITSGYAKPQASIGAVPSLFTCAHRSRVHPASPCSAHALMRACYTCSPFVLVVPAPTYATCNSCCCQVLLEKEDYPGATGLSNIRLLPFKHLETRCVEVLDEHETSQLQQGTRRAAMSRDAGCLGVRAVDGECAAGCANLSCETLGAMRYRVDRDCAGCSAECMCSPIANDYYATLSELCDDQMGDAMNDLHRRLDEVDKCRMELKPGDGVFFTRDVLHATQDFALKRLAISFDLA